MPIVELLHVKKTDSRGWQLNNLLIPPVTKVGLCLAQEHNTTQ